MLVTDRKGSLTVQISEGALTRLDTIRYGIGFRRMGAMLLAVRACGMAHGCGNNMPLYVREANGRYDRFQTRDCAVLPAAYGNRTSVTVLCTKREKCQLMRCAKRAGSLHDGLEKAIDFLWWATRDGFPVLYERLGNEFYPILPRGKS
jgi:hypothetical protein